MIGTINRRRAAQGGSPALPYDAEVEYLRGDGNAYIDLGIKVTSDMEIGVDFRYTTNENTTIFGSRTSPNDGKNIIGSGSSYTIIYVALGSSANTQIIPYDNQRHTIIVDISNSAATADNWTTQVNINGRYVANDLNAFLFGCNQGGSVYMKAKAEIYKCWLKKDGTYIIELIPVRVGDTGYMYDKVSGQLFGSGTGNFILGNDK